MRSKSRQRLVHNFDLPPPPPPPGQDKIDTTERRGQITLSILNPSTIVCKPRAL
jgi:trans-cinnamate 4-monooxygenase